MSGLLGWAIVIGGPLLCAAAGFGAAWLWQDRRADAVYDEGYQVGWDEAAYRAQLNYAGMHPEPVTITAIHPPGAGIVAAGGPGSDALWESITDTLRGEFTAIRAGLAASGPA